jgi:hypothetical protein
LLKSYGEGIEKQALIWVLSTFRHDGESRPAIQGLISFGQKGRIHDYSCTREGNDGEYFAEVSCQKKSLWSSKLPPW